MRVLGKEFKEWYATQWPSDDWYHDGYEIELHGDEGNWLIEDDKFYDSNDLGNIYWQGNGRPEKELDLWKLFREWKKKRLVTTFVADVPNERVDEFLAFMHSVGVKVSK